jgi:hypothetical protein
MPTLMKSMRIGGGTLSHSCAPTSAIYDDLRPHALDCWWNLAEELGDLIPEMRKVAREVLWGKVRDFCAPDDLELFEQQLGRVCALLGGGGRVHVSCLGGIGRTGLAIASIRVRALGEASEDSLAAAFEACGGPVTEQQRAFVRTIGSRNW